MLAVALTLVAAAAGVARAGYAITGLSCPSASLCVGSDDQGYGVASTDPTGPRSAWHTFPMFTGGFLNPSLVSCPTTTLCAATSAYQIAYSPHPAGGAQAWKAFEPRGYPQFFGLSCPSLALCVAQQSKGFYTSTTPTEGKTGWDLSQPYCTLQADGSLECLGGSQGGVSCPTTSMCVAALLGPYNETTDVGVADGPAGDPTNWSAPVMLDNYITPAAIACPSTTLCVISGYPGAIAVSTDPADGVWDVVRTSTVISTDEDPVACPSTSLCLVSDGIGGVLTSTDPAGAAQTWQEAPVAGSPLQAISCPSQALCVATDQDGNVYTSTDPSAGPEAQWKETTGVNTHLSASTALSIGHMTLSARFTRWQSVHLQLDWDTYIFGTRFKAKVSKGDLPRGSTVTASCHGAQCPSPPLAPRTLRGVDREHLARLRAWFGPFRFLGGDRITLTARLGTHLKRFHILVVADKRPLLGR